MSDCIRGALEKALEVRGLGPQTKGSHPQKNQDHFSPSVPIQPGIIPCTVPSVVIYAPSYLIFVPERYFSVSVLGLCASGTHFSSHGPEPRALDHTPPFESATTLKSCWNLLIIRFHGPDQHTNMPTCQHRGKHVSCLSSIGLLAPMQAHVRRARSGADICVSRGRGTSQPLHHACD